MDQSFCLLPSSTHTAVIIFMEDIHSIETSNMDTRCSSSEPYLRNRSHGVFLYWLGYLDRISLPSAPYHPM